MRKTIIFFGLCLCTAAFSNELGETIKIHTRFEAYEGKPSWLLVIRDLDHNQNIPYVYDIKRGDNYWLALTYGHNYLIQASTMQFSPFTSDPYRTKIVKNFCNLESEGRIIRGKSMHITLKGVLAPDGKGYSCQVMTYATRAEGFAKPR